MIHGRGAKYFHSCAPLPNAKEEKRGFISKPYLTRLLKEALARYNVRFAIVTLSHSIILPSY